MAGFVHGHASLKEAGVQVVKIFPEESIPEEVVRVEDLNIAFTYDDLLHESDPVKLLSREEREKVMSDFVQFGISLWGMRTISDQLPEQIGYVRGRGWILFDYNAGHATAFRISDGSPFLPDYSMAMADHHAVMNGDMMGGRDERLPLPREKQYRLAILNGIRAKREEQGLSPSLCTEIFQKIRSFNWFFAKPKLR